MSLWNSIKKSLNRRLARKAAETHAPRRPALDALEPRCMMFNPFGGDAVWSMTNLAYSYSNLLDGGMKGISSGELIAATREAMGVWSSYTQLTFTEMDDRGPSPTSLHGDSFSAGHFYDSADTAQIRWGHHDIDGLGVDDVNTLAHGAPPDDNGRGGDIHFDDAEQWRTNPHLGIDFLEIAVHELGHALGLGHSSAGVMRAIYEDGLYNGLGSAYLKYDDIDGIGTLYPRGLGYVLSLDRSTPQLDWELHVYGTANADTFDIKTENGKVTVRSLGLNGFERSLAGISSIHIHGQGGDDTFRLERSQGGPPIVLHGDGGNDVFDLSPENHNLGFLAARTDLDGGDGFDQVRLNDNNFSFNTTYMIDGQQAVRQGMGGVTFNPGVEERLLWTGRGADTVNIPMTYGGTHTTLRNGGNRDTVNLGNANGLQVLLGGVDVQAGGSVSLNINDSGNSIARSVIVSSVAPGVFNGGRGSVIGIAPADITWDTSAVESVILTTGSGGDVVDVRTLSAPLGLGSSGGVDDIRVSSVRELGNALTLRYSGGKSKLNLSNPAFEFSPLTRYVTVSDSMVEGLTTSPIRYSPGSLGELNIATGMLKDVVTLSNPPANTTVNTGLGDDTVIVRSTTRDSWLVVDMGSGTNTATLGGDGSTNRTDSWHNNLDDLAGGVLIAGGSGYDSVRLNDQATWNRPLAADELGSGWSNQPVVTVTDQSVTRKNTYSTSFRASNSGGGSVGFYESWIGLDGIDGVTYLAGASDDRILVQANKASTNLRLELGNGTNTVVVGGDGTANPGEERHNNLNDVLGSVGVVGGAGRDMVILNDQAAISRPLAPNTIGSGFTNRPVFTVTNEGITRENLFRTSYVSNESSGGSVTLLRSQINLLAGVESLEAFGGNSGNTFNIVGKDIAVPMVLHTGDGNDVVTHGDASNTLGSHQLTIDGQLGSDSLTLNDAAALNARGRYVVTNRDVRLQSDVGVVLASWNYQGLERLTLNASQGNDVIHLQSTAAGTAVVVNAGAGNDQFLFGDNSGTMNGIQGDLTLNGRVQDVDYFNVYDWQQTSGRIYRMSADTVTRDGMAPIHFSGITQIGIYGGRGDDSYFLDRTTSGTPFVIADNLGRDKLMAPATVNTWSTTGGGGGRLDAGMNTNAVVFNGIEGWIGGSGGDNYNLLNGHTILGWIDAAAGVDTLSYETWTTNVYVNIKTSQATGITDGVWNVQNIVGGVKDDILVGDIGNSLFGGAGRDLLIAGQKTSTLDGGMGEDLLIAGTTAYDSNPTSLQAIRDYWASADSYATRIAKLTAGTGVPKLTTATVFSNGLTNTLRGGDGRDYFFARLSKDSLADVLGDETKVQL